MQKEYTIQCKNCNTPFTVTVDEKVRRIGCPYCGEDLFLKFEESKRSRRVTREEVYKRLGLHSNG